jgi:aspartokinase/homoserine dehydrogenase 1
MKVLKFGGTSVGKPESLANVVKIVEAIEEPAVVVVSALGGITDHLINTAHLAASGGEYMSELNIMHSRHIDMINKLVPNDKQSDVLDSINDLFSQLNDIYRGLTLIKDLPQKTLDIIVSFGERASSLIVAAAIKNAQHFDSLTLIKTEKWFNSNIADSDLTEKLISEAFASLKAKNPAIMGGFISRDRDTDDITNLGRGGSDYTAAIVAATLHADILEIWTDVDGFMTSDPRIIPDAFVLPYMSFVESMELCTYGAKVIYPPTIYPVFHKNIPIKILNTFNPTAPGTFISDTPPSNGRKIKGLSSLKNVSLVSVEGIGIANIAGANSRIFNSLTKKGIRVLLVEQADKRISFAIADTDAELTQQLLNNEFAPELANNTVSAINLKSGLSIIAIVGENILEIPSIEKRIFRTIAENNIPMMAAASGMSQTTITFATPSEHVQCALAALHSELFAKQQ